MWSILATNEHQKQLQLLVFFLFCLVLLYTRIEFGNKVKKKGKTRYGLFVGGDSNSHQVEDWEKGLKIEQTKLRSECINVQIQS